MSLHRAPGAAPGAEISEALLIRALVGALAAGLVSAVAHDRRALSASGAWAACAAGTGAAIAGWAWAALLIAFFSATTALTKAGGREKLRRTNRILAPASARNATQVFANGGLFVMAALAGMATGRAAWTLAALGALAAATAVSWSTEVGTLLGGAPRSVLSGRVVAVGMSGGVTAAGLAGALAGATFIAVLAPPLLAGVLPVPAFRLVAAVIAGGVAGALADSLVGAGAQSRRFCQSCQEWTERAVHVCGAHTLHRAGLRWITNDVTNLLATVAGAAVAVSVSGLLRD